MSDAIGTPGGVVSDEDHRLALAGLIAPQSSTLAVRTGVMAGPSATTILTGTSATGTMTVNVGICHWVTTRAAGDGVYLGAKESSTTVNIAAAPASNSRIDVVYAKQNDAGSSISPDGSTGELYGVVTGTAAASPTKPALPLGAVEIGTVTVAVGATNTLGAGVTINNTAPLTVARGAPIPVRTQAERDALTGYTGAMVIRLDTGAIERYFAGVWGQPAPPDKPWTEIAGTGGTAYSYALTASFTTLPQMTTSVTVASGRTLDVEWKAPSVQTFATSNADLQLLIGGVVQDAAQFSTGSAPVFVPARLSGSVVGTGASVTITVQGRASAGSASVIGAGLASVKLRHRAW